ncbi:antiterminator LoaP [Paenibacillus caseinilyticus]|nr:antiterminator LoaP [Paenibacillus caseinilyticus]MCZ8522706.1 antiterminator LoaP [Paenibacillus caseinilyticus]
MLVHWYALFVESGQEDTVQHCLRKEFAESVLTSLVPKRRVPERKLGLIRHTVRNMFPGYVLIRTSLHPELYYTLRRIPHVLQLLTHKKNSSNEPLEYFTLSSIPEWEIAPLLELLDEADVMDYSTIRLHVHSQIQVVSGPLRGRERFIKKVDRHKQRATLQLPFLGECRSIEVGIQIVYPSIEQSAPL